MLATCGVLLCFFVWLLASQKKRSLCREGNRCCHFFAQAVSRVKAGNCLLTMPDNRCFLAFLFWLVTEGERA